MYVSVCVSNYVITLSTSRRIERVNTKTLEREEKIKFFLVFAFAVYIFFSILIIMAFLLIFYFVVDSKKPKRNTFIFQT